MNVQLDQSSKWDVLRLTDEEGNQLWEIKHLPSHTHTRVLHPSKLELQLFTWWCPILTTKSQSNIY